MTSRRRSSRPRRRRSTSRLPYSTTVIIVVLLVVVVPLILERTNLLDVFVDQPPAAVPVAEQVVTGEWYSVHFTTPHLTADLPNPTGGVPDAVAASIDEAQTTVDVAVYEFNLQVLADALLRAAERGLRVRVVTDTDSLGQPVIEQLRAAGIPVVDDARAAIMHHKFVVLDNASIWTGSMNFTRNDAYRNDNNFIRIHSTRLAQNYAHEFEEMFERRTFGPASPADTPQPHVTLNGTLIENYFSPDDGVAARIIARLQEAEHSIRFKAFSFTREDMANVLLERAAAGVLVQGVFETRQIAAGGNQAWLLLTAGGLDVRQDGNRYNLHSKVFVIDEAIVVTGSYNFSVNAEQRNDENVLIIHNRDIAQAYLNEWQRVWDVAAP
jgi:phosphatidylserine/phosphatidylglycerophosphate/cardiolipin synthase-like enzyme